MPGSVFIWVQHLLGIGHAMRAAHIARHLAARGWQVDLASGGMALPLDVGRARLHQLPPAKSADAEFSGLVAGDGRAANEAFKSQRRDRLLALWRAANPDIVLIEHYPFGRRQLRFELEPLLAAARARRPRPLVLCSVRDVVVRRSPEREAETAALIESGFDGVLVHGDAALLPLSSSFPAAPRIAAKLIYTGYVGGAETAPPMPMRRGIVVSTGGGAVGETLMAVAIAAARLMPDDHPWRMLCGAQPDHRLEALRRSAPPHMTVEPARPDFRRLLAGAALSVSQAGYNTVVDILAARVRSILVPFATERETEQTERAESLAKLGLAGVVAEARLTGAVLARAIAEALAKPVTEHRLRIDGEAETERVLRHMLARHRRHPEEARQRRRGTKISVSFRAGPKGRRGS